MNSHKPAKKSNRMKNIICGIIVLSAIFYSCTNRSPVNSGPFPREQLIHIDLKRNDRISVYDLFSEVKIIPLETTPHSLLTFPIGEPDRVIVSEGKYYFMDEQLQSIIVFSSDGKFLKKIDNRGNGPDEYPTINDFNINRFNQNMEILSPEGRSIYVYDSSGDIFIEKINLPADLPVVYFFHHLTTDIYVFTSALNEIIFYSKKDNRTIRSDYSFPEWLRKTTFDFSHNPFYVYNDSLCLELIHNGDVFTISPETYKLQPRYNWDFGQHNFDLSILPENESINFYLDLSKKIYMDYAVLFPIYKENSRYYMTRFKFENRYKHLVFDKKTGQYLLFEKFKEGGQCLPYMDRGRGYLRICTTLLFGAGYKFFIP